MRTGSYSNQYWTCPKTNLILRKRAKAYADILSEFEQNQIGFRTGLFILTISALQVRIALYVGEFASVSVCAYILMVFVPYIFCEVSKVVKIIADTHCHTVASVHAYSTILENVKSAKSKNLWAIAITDHNGNIPGAPGPWYFDNLKILPKEIDKVKILRGMEANVLDSSGRVDIPELEFRLDWIIASIHEVTWNGTHGIEECTNAWLAVAENPLVNVIGHSGVPGFEYDFEKVIPVFKEKSKLVEINSSSFDVRVGSHVNCEKIAKCCKKYGTPVIVNSDAHICEHVGQFDNAIKLLESVEFPEDLIINSNTARFEEYIRKNTVFFS
jgi:putative hydrolase